jgi:hypothetical protein
LDMWLIPDCWMKPQEGEVLEACGTNMGAFT